MHRSPCCAPACLQKKRGEDGGEVLNPLDKLYVVHVQHSNKKDELKERWDAGGPLLPSLATALASFPHKVVELEKDSVRPCAPDHLRLHLWPRTWRCSASPQCRYLIAQRPEVGPLNAGAQGRASKGFGPLSAGAHGSKGRAGPCAVEPGSPCQQRWLVQSAQPAAACTADGRLCTLRLAQAVGDLSQRLRPVMECSWAGSG